MARTEVALRQDAHPEAPHRKSSGAAWGIVGLMNKDIVPDDPKERRMRSRMRALRAADSLGLLGEENLIPTLARRPALRWLADEDGARWAVLAELGCIGEPGAFEEAVEWVLENRPRPEEARAYVNCRRKGIGRPACKERVGRKSLEQRAASGPRLRMATETEEEQRC